MGAQLISALRLRLLGVTVAAVLAAACATPGPEAPQSPALSPKALPLANDRVPAFSAAKPEDLVPAGWQQWVLHPTKRRTVYSMVSDAGIMVVRAVAESSASGLITPLDIDLQSSPVLEWRWRTERLIADADNSVAATEDAPVRIVLAFDGDKSGLSLRERLFAERVRLISGRELPYATLMYIWENQKPKEALIDNPHSERIKKLVVDTGPNRLGEWRLHRRNIIEDYQRAFGTLPGRLVGIGIMTDTDNTGSRAAAYYGDIRMLPAGQNNLSQ